MKKWEYAEFTKTASEYGGPKNFLTEYGEEKFNEGKLVGEEIGESRGEIKGLIEGGVLTVIIGGITLGVLKFRERKVKKTAEKIAVSRERAGAAAKEYLESTEDTYEAEYEEYCEEDYEDDK